MKHILPILLLLLITPFTAKAQSLKVYAGFSNLHSDVFAENLQGVTLEAQYKLYSYEKVKLEVVGDFSAHYREFGPNPYQYLAGPQVSLDLLDGHLTPFVRTMFGTTRQGNQGSYTHSIGGGVDIKLGKHYGVRPVLFDSQTIEGVPFRVNKVGGGVYVTF